MNITRLRVERGTSPMATKAKKIHALIHAAAAASAAAGGGLAQVPGSDAAVITPIQVAMIVAIGAEHGTPIGKSAAAGLILSLSAAAVGRGLSQCLLGWVPGLGNAVNAITAAALTEAIGWAADAYFAEGNAALDRPSQSKTEQCWPWAG